MDSVFQKPLDDDIQDVAECMAIVINGDTAPQAISSGQYLFIKNHSTLATGGYHATAAIASGGSVTSSNVAADANGIVNAAYSSLNGKVTTVETISTGITGVYARKMGKLVKLYFHDFHPASYSVGTLPDSLKPESIVYCPIFNSDSTASRMMSISPTGQITGTGTVMSASSYGSIMYFANS